MSGAKGWAIAAAIATAVAAARVALSPFTPPARRTSANGGWPVPDKPAVREPRAAESVRVLNLYIPSDPRAAPR